MNKILKKSIFSEKSLYICKKIIMRINIDDKLHSEIKEYCKINDLKLTEFVNTLIQKAFNLERYGSSPFENMTINIEVNSDDKNNKIKEVEKKTVTIIETVKEETNIIPQYEHHRPLKDEKNEDNKNRIKRKLK